MEIERDVGIEVVKDEADPKWDAIAGFSSGPRTIGSLPAFSDEELKKSLGKVSAEIRALFLPAKVTAVAVEPTDSPNGIPDED